MVSEPILLSKRSRWLLLLGIVLPWLLFVGLAIAVRQSPQGIFQEQNLLWAIHHTANPVLDQLATIVTCSGHFGYYSSPGQTVAIAVISCHHSLMIGCLKLPNQNSDCSTSTLSVG